MESFSACLAVLIHVIVLNLAEIPVIGIDQFGEIVCISVVGETDVADLSALQLFLNPVIDSHGTELFPGGQICQHMHQIIINVICPQTLQFLLKTAFHAGFGFNQVMRQLGCDIYGIAQVIAFQYCTQGSFTAVVNVCGIKIIDACFNGGQNFLFCFLQINLSVLFAEAKTAISKNG